MKTIQLICFKVVNKQVQQDHIPERSEVASASCPKKAIIAEMKRQESVKARKTHKTTKHNEASHTTINWQSPTFWPIIDMVAGQQVGNLTLLNLWINYNNVTQDSPISVTRELVNGEISQ